MKRWADPVFHGFDQNSEEETDDPVAIEKVYEGSSSSPKYIDLEDPDNPLSSGSGSTAWDILIKGKELLTNSGTTATAEGTTGLGGIVYGGSSNFSFFIGASGAQVLFEQANRLPLLLVWIREKTSPTI